MRWKIIVVNAGIVLTVAALSYFILWRSLAAVLEDPSERKRELVQAARSASTQLALDALRLERWLEAQATTENCRSVFAAGTAQARSERATAEADRLRDAATHVADFSGLAPSLVLFSDERGVVLGRNGSALMRGERLASSYASLAEVTKHRHTGSAVWFSAERQEQLLVSYAPVLSSDGRALGVLALGTPLNDERITRTSAVTSGQALLLRVVLGDQSKTVADSSNTPASVLADMNDARLRVATTLALSSNNVADGGVSSGYLLGAIRLEGYGETPAVLIAAVPASLVPEGGGVLWPIIAASALGVVLVVIGGFLLGNYISRPIAELEEGLLSVINGNSQHRFQLEHAELGGLVFRINSLLNALMGVPDDTTDDEGRPSESPSGRPFQEALSVDESLVSGEDIDAAVRQSLARQSEADYQRELYASYIAAKRELGDPVDHISAVAFHERIRQSSAEISHKHGSRVRYRVERRGNAVVLLAVPMAPAEQSASSA